MVAYEDLQVGKLYSYVASDPTWVHLHFFSPSNVATIEKDKMVVLLDIGQDQGRTTVLRVKVLTNTGAAGWVWFYPCDWEEIKA